MNTSNISSCTVAILADKGAMTEVTCTEGSSVTQYLGLLNNGAAGGPDGAGALALETAGGATVKP